MKLIALILALFISTVAQAQDFTAAGWSWIEAGRAHSLDEALRQAQGYRLEFPHTTVMQSNGVYVVAIAIVRDSIVQREADALMQDRRLSQTTISKGDSYLRLIYGINPFTADVQYSLSFPRAQAAPAKMLYIQLASRISLSQAAELTLKFKERDLEPSIVLLRSGWFAVVIPPSPKNTALITTLKREKRIPSDSALVTGQNFNEVVWSSSIPPDPRLKIVAPELFFRSADDALSAGNGAAALAVLRSQLKRTGRTDFALGYRILSQGLGGVRPDSESSMAWLRVCSEHREQTCMLRLAESFKFGLGVPKDPVRAFQLFKQLAGMGSAIGQYNLASMLIVGDGALQDFDEAVRLLRISAVAGVPEAQGLLGKAYKNGFATTRDGNKAYFWLSLAAAGSTSEAGRASAIKDRDLVASNIAASMLGSLQKITREWKIGDPEPAFEDLPKQDEATVIAESSPSKSSTKESEPKSGSGFFVSSQGHVVTNAHVVNGCSTFSVVTVGGVSRSATLVAKDERNDLAVLSVPQPTSAVAGIRAGAKLGEGVAVFGFPLNGLLSSHGNFTTGNVVALTGLADDSRHLQISAPVQPGNSGGPLMDNSGAVVGVVVSKADALLFAKLLKDIPQNINFAIKAAQLTTFLDASNVPYESVGQNATLSSDKLAERARDFSVLIRCK